MAPDADAGRVARPKGRAQAWIERNRAKIWIWGIAGLAFVMLGAMMLFVLVVILTR